MKRDIWTDRELREAAKKVREAMLDSVPPPRNVPMSFPCPIRQKWQNYQKRQKKKQL